MIPSTRFVNTLRHFALGQKVGCMNEVLVREASPVQGTAASFWSTLLAVGALIRRGLFWWFRPLTEEETDELHNGPRF